MGAIKRDKYDKVFSDLVRERSDYNCERCGKNYRHKTGGLHCSHYVGRRHQATRYDPDNAFSHCHGCHAHMEQNPGLFQRFYVSLHGAYAEQAIVEKGRQIKKWLKGEKEEMYQHLKSELKRLLELRRQGVVGYIEVTGWD